ncbi:MAG: hypothetical protein SWO11_20825 [Thermodesulfobacteriota bacterium]|nr:hypothetical protein [Thermodesulfobacteriota bacterium]
MKSTEKNGIQEPKKENVIQMQEIASSETDDLGNMNKIRDILFGNQIRDYENRFTKMELLLKKETNDLRSETLKRIDILETYIKDELNALTKCLEKESDERSETDKTLSHEIKDLLATMNKKIGQVEDRSEKRSRDLREQILEQAKRLTRDIKEKYELNSSELNEAISALTEAKVDRSALSELFINLAINLSDEARISEIVSAQKK